MNTISSDAEACRYFIELIYNHCRINLHQGKEPLIKARLGKLMRRHAMASLAEYAEFLRSGADEREFTQVVDALTTNYTQFLREPDHFEFMVQQALPKVLADGRKHFHIWSAAASSGEEPYSIALYLAEHYPADRGWDWLIVASDLSTKALAAAQRGVYAQERIHAVPQAWLHKYFQRGMGSWEGQVRVRPELARRVNFRQLNLIGTYDHAQPFAVIFCRNVMIYFDRPTQEELVNRLCRHLVPGGYLFTGHSESLNGLDVPLRCLKPSIYQLL